MTFDPRDLPFDAAGELVGPRLVLHNALLESLRSQQLDSITSDKRARSRSELLGRKLHTVGRVNLPIPNLVAQQLIEKLPTEDPLRFVAETVFILSNQMNEDVLFSEGIERERAIAAVVKHIPAQSWGQYYVCIRELLAELEKKTKSYLEKIEQKSADLMQQLKSFSSPKPTDNPSAIGSPS